MVKVQLGLVRAQSLTTRKTTSLLMTGFLALSVGVAGHSFAPSFDASDLRAAEQLVAVTEPALQQIVDLPPVQAAASAAAEVKQMATQAVAPAPQYFTREVELSDGQSFARMLTDSAASPEDAAAAAEAFAKVYDHRRLKAGQEVTLSFVRSGEDEILTAVALMPEATKEIVLSRNDAGKFTGQMKTIPLERQRIAARGEIRSSLYEAGARQGVPRAIMAAIIRAYSHAVDFQRDIHPGDKFEVLYDQPTSRDGTPVGNGVIIYAALEIAGEVKPLYRVTFGNGAVDYFDEKGQSVRRSLLRTPVDGARVTSNYGMRVHPLLGFSKMHKGVDFGAPIGTPILAAGSGTVVESGFKGAYGRYVRIRHAGSGRIETAYAHMSRIGRDVYSGARVNQGDVIGFVGVSGRTTGPHLHFEVMQGGNQVNPLSVNLRTGHVLEGQALTQFRQGQNRIKGEFVSLLTQGAGSAVRPVSTPIAPAPVQKPSEDKRIEANAGGDARSYLRKAHATEAPFAAQTGAQCGDKGC